MAVRPKAAGEFYTEVKVILRAIHECLGHYWVPSECDRYRGHVINMLSNSYNTPIQQVLRLLFQTQEAQYQPKDLSVTTMWMLRPYRGHAGPGPCYSFCSLLFLLLKPLTSPQFQVHFHALFQFQSDVRAYSACLS